METRAHFETYARAGRGEPLTPEEMEHLMPVPQPDGRVVGWRRDPFRGWVMAYYRLIAGHYHPVPVLRSLPVLEPDAFLLEDGEPPYPADPCPTCEHPHGWGVDCDEAPAGLADTLEAERARDLAKDLADARDDSEQRRIVFARGPAGGGA